MWMATQISVSEYCQSLTHQVHEVISLPILLKPFKLFYPGPDCDDILVGCFLEYLMEQHLDSIDPMDVASLALSLGYDEAETFLDSALNTLSKVSFHTN
jgi:hypothetical protein